MSINPSITQALQADVPKRSALLRTGIVVLLSVFLTSFSLAEPISFDEYLVKAAFLYNFAKFVEWPADPALGTPTPQKFTIGILGTNPFGDALDSLTQQNLIQGRQVLVRHFERLKDVRECQVLYVGASEMRNLPAVFETLKGTPILTVSDLEGFAFKGGMIGFLKEDNRILFEINLDAVKHQGLKIRTPLLKLAKKIIFEKHPKEDPQNGLVPKGKMVGNPIEPKRIKP